MSYYKNKKVSRPQSKTKDRDLKFYVSNLKNAVALNNMKTGQRLQQDLNMMGASRERLEKSSSFKYMGKDFNSSRKSVKSTVRNQHNSSKGFMGSDRKRAHSHKRNRPRMEHRYNSNKVLEYKKTPSKSKKRTLNGSANNSFVANSKRGSKYNLREPAIQYSKDNLYSDRRIKNKKYDKRSLSSGIRKAKELYLADDTKSSPVQSSSKKDKSGYKRYEDSSLKSSKSKKSSYKTSGINYYFSQPTTSGLKVVKQHNIARKHVDHKIPSNSFHYNAPNDMFSPGNSGKMMNQSAIIQKGNMTAQQLHKSRRMQGLSMVQGKSRENNHYRMNSSSQTGKVNENRSSSVVHPSDLTPLHSNCIKTVKTKNTNEDTLLGSNAYKISTMENSIKKGMKKSLNLSSNQYHECPTTTDWHSSLVNQREENIEEVHYYFVILHQKKKKLIDRLEKMGKNINSAKRSKRKNSKRSTSAKRRRNEAEVAPAVSESEAQYEFITQKNSNVELCVQDVILM